MNKFLLKANGKSTPHSIEVFDKTRKCNIAIVFSDKNVRFTSIDLTYDEIDVTRLVSENFQMLFESLTVSWLKTAE